MKKAKNNNMKKSKNNNMKKSKNPPVMHAGALTVGPFKRVTYYKADIEGPDAELDMIADLGKQVTTREQYLNIGMNHIIMNMVNNKFELKTTNNAEDKTGNKKVVNRSKGILIDPPSGWRYGFPARYIKEEHGTMEDFLRLMKYPEKDIAFAMQNMRHLGEEES